MKKKHFIKNLKQFCDLMINFFFKTSLVYLKNIHSVVINSNSIHII